MRPVHTVLQAKGEELGTVQVCVKATKELTIPENP